MRDRGFIPGLLTFAAFCCVILFSVSCAVPEAGDDRRLSDLVAHMIKEVGGEASAMMMVEPVRASDGIAVRIAGREVAFYKYDLSLEKARRKYDHIKATKAVYISGTRFDAELNGPFMMIDHVRNMKRDEILKAFRSFK